MPGENGLQIAPYNTAQQFEQFIERAAHEPLEQQNHGDAYELLYTRDENGGPGGSLDFKKRLPASKTISEWWARRQQRKQTREELVNLINERFGDHLTSVRRGWFFEESIGNRLVRKHAPQSLFSVTRIDEKALREIARRVDALRLAIEHNDESLRIRPYKDNLKTCYLTPDKLETIYRRAEASREGAVPDDASLLAIGSPDVSLAAVGDGIAAAGTTTTNDETHNQLDFETAPPPAVTFGVGGFADYQPPSVNGAPVDGAHGGELFDETADPDKIKPMRVRKGEGHRRAMGPEERRRLARQPRRPPINGILQPQFLVPENPPALNIQVSGIDDALAQIRQLREDYIALRARLAALQQTSRTIADDPDFMNLNAGRFLSCYVVNRMIKEPFVYHEQDLALIDRVLDAYQSGDKEKWGKRKDFLQGLVTESNNQLVRNDPDKPRPRILSDLEKVRSEYKEREARLMEQCVEVLNQHTKIAYEQSLIQYKVAHILNRSGEGF